MPWSARFDDPIPVFFQVGNKWVDTPFPINSDRMESEPQFLKQKLWVRCCGLRHGVAETGGGSPALADSDGAIDRRRGRPELHHARANWNDASAERRQA
jgi:hypothetical protein